MQGARSTHRSSVQRPLCLEEGVRVQKISSQPWAVAVCLGNIQRSFLALSDSRGDDKVHVQPGKVMISSCSQSSGTNSAAQNKVTHISEQATPLKHPKSSQILALFISEVKISIYQGAVPFICNANYTQVLT